MANRKSASQKQDYLQSLKSIDTEEHIDLYFYRRVGYVWAKLAQRLGISPNAITIASIFLGAGAGIAFYFNDLQATLLGMLLLVWANTFDSTDGQLARMTKQYSRLGRILDGVSSDIWFVCIYVAICLRENAVDPYFEARPWLVWTLAVAAGASHVVQAAMADYFRQLHLYFLKGEAGSELDTAADIARSRRGMSWRHDFWKKLTATLYLNYTRAQEALSPNMQRLRRRIRKRYGTEGSPAALCRDFRRRSLPLMKYANILSFNWRTIVLFASLLAMQPWIYFVVELTVGNLLLLYMLWRHGRTCRHITDAMETGCYNSYNQ